MCRGLFSTVAGVINELMLLCRIESLAVQVSRRYSPHRFGLASCNEPETRCLIATASPYARSGFSFPLAFYVKMDLLLLDPSAGRKISSSVELVAEISI